MEALKSDVIARANALYLQYLAKDMASDKYPPYKASGMAYIRFAKEEKELFKLLFMRDRTEENIQKSEDFEQIVSIIQKSYGFSREKAELFHLGMWVYVHGIATMVATNYLSWDAELTSRMLTTAFGGMQKQFLSEEEK